MVKNWEGVRSTPGKKWKTEVNRARCAHPEGLGTASAAGGPPWLGHMVAELGTNMGQC